MILIGELLIVVEILIRLDICCQEASVGKVNILYVVLGKRIIQDLFYVNLISFQIIIYETSLLHVIKML